jgi:hypothetical protein
MVYNDPFQKIEGFIPEPGANGNVPYSAGNSFAELLGALMQQQQYNRGNEEQGRRTLQQQSAEIPRQARGGIQAPQQQMAAQFAQQAAAPRQQFTDPMIETLLAQKMQMALSDQNYRMMLEVMKRNQPSMLAKYAPLAGTAIGSIWGPAGASVGSAIGQGVAQTQR